MSEIAIPADIREKAYQLAALATFEIPFKDDGQAEAIARALLAERLAQIERDAAFVHCGCRNGGCDFKEAEQAIREQRPIAY